MTVPTTLPADVETLQQLVLELQEALQHQAQKIERFEHAANLPNDVDTLKRTVLEQQEAVQRLQRRNEQLEHHMQQLLKARFGPRADRLNPNQLLLFAAELIEEATQPEPAPRTNGKAATKRPGHGRRPLPKDLPRERVVHDLPEAEKRCPGCGEMRERISEEVSEQLELVPARLYVIEHVQPKYACKHCQANVAMASKPLQPIEKGLPGPGLLAQVVVSKYGDHQPLHRQEQILARSGQRLPRSTMCGWMFFCATLLRPLAKRMAELVRASRCINTDDTPVPVLVPKTGKTRTGRIWVYVGDRGHPYTIFDYTPNHSRDGPTNFFGDYAGYIQADAYGGYDQLFKPRGDGAPGRPLPTEVGCWAHARRKFVEAEHSDALRAHVAVAMIRLLYEVEAEAKQRAEARLEADLASESLNESDRAARLASYLAEERLALRLEKSQPQLAQFEDWLQAQKADVLPKSPMGQAIDYCLSNWTALTRYTENGELAIDNNAAENALRPVAVGRKNWLFAGSDEGGRTGATLMSLVASCKRHGVDPFAYLRDVLTRLPATPVNELDQFLPDRWKAARTASTT